MSATPVWVQLVYLLAAVCFILALKGLSSPQHARRGNLIGAFGAVMACVVVFFYGDLQHVGLILVAIAVGTAIGFVGARRVQMTQMPQLVALFNGVGGGAAALVALLELSAAVDGAVDVPAFTLAATAFTILVGSVSFAGSLVTFAKLQELMTSRPVVFPGLPVAFALSLLGALVLGVLTVTQPALWVGAVLAVVGLLLGVLLVLPVGGADVPDRDLAAERLHRPDRRGGRVRARQHGAAGRRHPGRCERYVPDQADGLGDGPLGRQHPLRGARGAAPPSAPGRPPTGRCARPGPQDVAILLGYASRVIIVPGYGLAVAQAQHTLRELVDLLIERGASVDYAIHPVAGRMPGHMNVLLAEAQVPYEQLREMDDINSEFKQADVVLVVGANDVVNPAARTSPGAPIYGMPILNADEAQQVVFMKRSMRPGFAGIENELLFDPKTTLLFGDAKDSLGKLLNAVKAL